MRVADSVISRGYRLLPWSPRDAMESTRNSEGSLTRKFDVCGPLFTFCMGWKLAEIAENQPKSVSFTWLIPTWTGLFHTLGQALGHPGLLRDWFLATLVHTGSPVAIHQGLLEIAHDHLFRFSFSSQGQSAFLQPGWMNHCSRLFLLLSDAPGKVYTW